MNKNQHNAKHIKVEEASKSQSENEVVQIRISKVYKSPAFKRREEE